MKRHIGLYYASINFKVIFWSLINIPRKIFCKKESLHERLVSILGAQFGCYKWFCLSSARGALAFMLKSAGIGIGDEVVISAYTCLAVPTAILATGATPVYVDIDVDTLNINFDKLKNSITPTTKAIVIQHTLGNIFPVRKLKSQSWAKDILIIEDCALSIGSRIDGELIGLEGDAAIFSMELSKTLSCGWGGLLLISNANYAARAENLYSRLPSQNIFRSLLDFFQTTISGISYHPNTFPVFGKYLIWLFYKFGVFRNSTAKEELVGKVAHDFIKKLGIAQVALAEIQWLNFFQLVQGCAIPYHEIASVACELGYKTHFSGRDDEFCVSNRVSLVVKNPSHTLEFFANNNIDLGVWFDGPLSPLPIGEPFNYEPFRYPCSASVAKHVINIPSHSRLNIRDRNKIIKTLSDYTLAYPDAILAS